MITAVFGNRLVILVVAVMPSMPGILTSIRTMFGSSRSHRLSASSPLSAIPTTSTSGSKRSSFATLSRLSAMSSTIRTRILPLIVLACPALASCCQLSNSCRLGLERRGVRNYAIPAALPIEMVLLLVVLSLRSLDRLRPWHRVGLVRHQDLERDASRRCHRVVILAAHDHTDAVVRVLHEGDRLGLLRADFQDQLALVAVAAGNRGSVGVRNLLPLTVERHTRLNHPNDLDVLNKHLGDRLQVPTPIRNDEFGTVISLKWHVTIDSGQCLLVVAISGRLIRPLGVSSRGVRLKLDRE